MGKSATLALFAERGAPVYDADAAVHALYTPGGAAVAAVEAAFPGVGKDGGIDRAALGARVLNDPEAMKKLEAIVHPLVRQAQADFIDKALKDGAELAIVDVPLLYESGGDANVDAVIVCSAPAPLQKRRVLERPGMDAGKFAAILSKQMLDSEKRARADFVLDTSRGEEDARDQVAAILREVSKPDWRGRANKATNSA
jgi:dephospho-CoA kinase